MKIFDVLATTLKPDVKHFMDIMNANYAMHHFPCKLWDAAKKSITVQNSFADFNGMPSSPDGIQLLVYSVKQ